MPCQHSLVPVGMMGVSTDPNGSNLQSDLQKVRSLKQYG
jgi:hypothetical protein